MSNLTYRKCWADINQDLVDQLSYESPLDPSMVPKDRESASQHLTVLCVKYIQIFKKIETTYDQIVHPQKRRLIKGVLIAVLGRLLEIKHKLVELECSDIQEFTNVLWDLKLTPDDMAINVPRYFLEDRRKTIEERDLLLNALNAKVLMINDSSSVFPEMKRDEAVRIIQLNERGRQGKLRAKYMRDMRLQAMREKELDGNDDETQVNQAALAIQRIYKGYKARQVYKRMLHEELIFLGMKKPPRDLKRDPIAKAELNRVRRKALQGQHEDEYQQALVNTKEKILRVEGPDMKEAMQDSFRQWYMEYKRINGKYPSGNNEFPDFPADKVWQQPTFKFAIESEPKPGEEGAAQADGAKPDAEPKESAKASTPANDKNAKNKKKGEPEEEDPDKFKFDDSPFLENIRSEYQIYFQNWHSKDESDNFAQKHDQDIIKVDKRNEAEAEIKLEVFEILKEELKNLKMAVDREKASKGKKGKKGKGKKGGKKKGKGGKKGKGKKGKKEKDLTANRTMESLVEELVQNGIIQKTIPIGINDFIGDQNLLAQPANKPLTLEPKLGELKRLLTEYAILPLGASIESLHGVVSMLLCGARGTGKTMLLNAIANEAGAMIFNISPSNTAGLYLGKPAVTKLLHMVFKVARAHAPAIVYLDKCEMVFAKKVPKDDTTDPKRIRKDLLKSLKGLKPVDRVMLIGTSWKPWDADPKVFLPVWQKIVMCPKPDYGERCLIWSRFLGERIAAMPGASHGGTFATQMMERVNVSLLTRLSDGVTAGSIATCCDRLLTERRMKRLRSQPLRTEELIEHLLNLGPINKDEDKMLKEWFERTPLPRKRAQMLATPVEEDPNKGKKKPAGKDKKGK